MVKDQHGIIKTVGELCEKHDISIFAVLQSPITDPENVPFVITTESTKVSRVEAMVADLRTHDFMTGTQMIMPML